MEGIWNDTIVVVISEMTRTPKLNATVARPLAQHVALVFGGGLEGGVLGGTATALWTRCLSTWRAARSTSRGTVITYGSFAAGVLHAAGVDTHVYMPDEEVLHGIVDG